MTRTPVSEDSKAITERIAELRAERLAMAVGCDCPIDPHTNTAGHKTDCPLRPLISVPISMTARARENLPSLIPTRILTDHEKQILKRAWERSTRLIKTGKLVSLLLAMALAFDPHILFLSWSAERQERVPATNLMVCNEAIQAIRKGWWLADDPPSTMNCIRGNGFTAESQCIKNHNCGKR